ncbi:MAG: hypothetical protein IJW45_08475, partial [Oscillospiraceae bacterium]|nr:hypothetical protein [Oscillospiraceae bacterium]
TEPEETEPKETEPEETEPEETEPEETEPEETEPEETEPEETEPEETEPEETEPEETEPEETEPGETEPEETEPEETEPEEKEPEETEPEETGPEEPGTGDVVPDETIPDGTEPDGTEPDPGDGDVGNDDGIQGGEGGDVVLVDLAAVLTWYKYGTQPKDILCQPSGTVAANVNTAQLVDDVLKYRFSVAGEEADYVRITAVAVKEGDGRYTTVSDSGEVTIVLPEGGQRDYTFQVRASYQKTDPQGTLVEQELTFAYVLHCRYDLDLELGLEWRKADGSGSTLVCPANATVRRTVESNEILENTLAYSLRLTGALADDARIVSGEYSTDSGETGTLDVDTGSLILRCADGSDEERYHLTFTVERRDEDGDIQTIFYHFTIDFVEALDIQLSFVWLEKGMTRRTMICQPGGSVSTNVKNDQLSAGAVKYEIALEGASSGNARILSITYTSEASESGTLEQEGALPVTLPEGYSSNTYTISVAVLVNGEQLSFQIRLRYVMDARLQMTYTVDGEARTVSCENGRSVTAEEIYDDQLTDGLLSYEMSIVGGDASDVSITSVTCYQSGSGRTVTLESVDQIALLLEDGATGENSFTVTAQDGDGTVYGFKINIPYKHRGEDRIKITTNLVDGQTVTNETDINLRVNAWSEDENGDVISYIPANGTDTKLIVTLDGEQVGYVSSSGSASEYILHPENPSVGDTNTHTLHIYAEDALGNFGELTLTLNGQRNQAGQRIGTATIYIDLSVLGLGVVETLRYDVLADEPISYVVAKAVLGMDVGEPFGAAEDPLGWNGSYSGTLDDSFYLQSLSTGYSADTLSASSWSEYGSNEEEILSAIDSYYGKGTGLATLWRCIYRNGLNKSGGTDGTYGEFDYTSGSGWLFSVDGTTYPGLSMSDYYLSDGSVLVLRYTLAYGWDVGGGTQGYGNSIGYCVSAVNGTFTIEHRMEYVENADGSVSYVCHCCGMVEDCAHEDTLYLDLEDGTHILYCNVCRTTIGDPEEHTWGCTDEAHSCTGCGVEESHTWREVAGSNTATCTEAGTRTVYCTVCAMTREEQAPAKGHTLDSRWNYTDREHYRKCSTCGEEMDRGEHQYVYDEEWEDYACGVCGVLHDWDVECAGTLTVEEATCERIVYHCDGCGLDLICEGYFQEHHCYEEGVCTVCGEEEPDEEESTGSAPPD